MATVTDLRRKYENSISKISDEEVQELAKLEKKKRKELEKAARTIENSFKLETGRVRRMLDSERERKTKEYLSSTFELMLDSLKQDYATIQERSGDIEQREGFLQLSSDEQDSVAGICTDLKTAKSPEALGLARKMIERMPEKIQQAVSIYESHDFKEKVVTSYIAYSNDRGFCYFITPVDGKENKTLAKNLEDRVIETFQYDGGSITLDCSATAMPDGTLKASTKKIKFETDFDEHHEFLVFKLKPHASDNAQALAMAMIGKLNKLQPSTFKKTGLTHKIEEIDIDVADYFTSEKTTSNYVSIEQAARLLRKKGPYAGRVIKQLATKGILKENSDGEIDVKSVMKYAETNGIRPVKLLTRGQKVASDEGVKGEIYQRLNHYGETLTINDYMAVMGIESWPGAKRQIESIKSAFQEGEKKAWQIPKEGVVDFLGSHYFSGKRWYKKRD